MRTDRAHTMRPLLAAVLLLLLPVSARADGLPQLDFSTPLTISQVVWGAIIFAAFYFLASRFALPQVAAVLEERAGNVGRDLETAQKAKTEADAAVAEMTRATHEAHAKALAEIAAAAAVAKAAADAEAAAANAMLDAQISAAEANIGAARRAALGALEQAAVQIVQDVVTRLTGTLIDHGAVPRAVAAALAAHGQRTA
jgi:F-type H+-transporting ATPase subunit b